MSVIKGVTWRAVEHRLDRMQKGSFGRKDHTDHTRQLHRVELLHSTAALFSKSAQSTGLKNVRVHRGLIP